MPRGKQGGRAAGGGDPFGGGGCFGRRAGARLGLVGRLPASPAPSIACPRFSAPLVHSPLCSTTSRRFAIFTASSATSRRQRRLKSSSRSRAGIAPESGGLSFGAAPAPCGNPARHAQATPRHRCPCSNPFGVSCHPIFQPPKAASGNFWLRNVTGR